MHGCIGGVLMGMVLKTQLFQEGFIVQTVKQRSVSKLIQALPLKYLKLVILINRPVSWWPFSHAHYLYIKMMMILAVNYAYLSSKTKAQTLLVSVHAIIYRSNIHITLYCTFLSISVPVLQESRKEKSPQAGRAKSWNALKGIQNSRMQKWPCEVEKSQQGSEGLVLMGIRCIVCFYVRQRGKGLRFACWESSHGVKGNIRHQDPNRQSCMDSL